MSKRYITYAQNREDYIIKAFFENVDHGFYIDIGANHPVDDSVTKTFYDEGWSGINVEPNARLHKLLQKERPRDVNLPLAISCKSDKLEFRQYEGYYAGLSTASDRMKNENKKEILFSDIEVDAITLADLFDKYISENTTVNFLKIDVEGYEREVIESNNWKKYRPQLICIESNHEHEDWHKLLDVAGYKKVFYDGLNEYFLAAEHMGILKDFSYVQSILGRDLVTYKMNKHLTEIEYKLDKTASEIATYRSENLQLQRDVIELKKVIPLTKQLVKSLDGAVRRRIEKLNIQKIKSMPAETSDKLLDIENVKSPKVLYKRIQLYDMKNLYSNRYEKDRLMYRITSGVYDWLSKLAFKFGKFTFSIVRRIRGNSNA